MSDPWFKFYASDWLAGTRGLTAAETGIYVTLIAMMYERGDSIPRDDARLSRLCGCPKASFSRALNALIDEGKITEADSCLSNSRVEKERQCRAEKSQKARDSALKKWSAHEEKAKQKQRRGDADAEQNRCELDANQIPEARSQINEDTNVSLSLVPTDDGPDEITQAVSLFKSAAEESGWPVPRILSKARKSALRARLKECDGIEGWKVALDKAQASKHCCGEGGTGWKISFDFITTQSGFAKLMEGNYDNRTDSVDGREHSDTHSTNRAIDVASRARRAPQENIF